MLFKSFVISGLMVFISPRKEFYLKDSGFLCSQRVLLGGLRVRVRGLFASKCILLKEVRVFMPQKEFYLED